MKQGERERSSRGIRLVNNNINTCTETVFPEHETRIEAQASPSLASPVHPQLRQASDGDDSNARQGGRVDVERRCLREWTSECVLRVCVCASAVAGFPDSDSPAPLALSLSHSCLICCSRSCVLESPSVRTLTHTLGISVARASEPSSLPLTDSRWKIA